MSSNNIIIAKNRKNNVLKFSGMEDWNEILKEFKECMNRNNHAGVLSGYDYDEPIEPIKAIRRINGRSKSRPKPTDQRDLSNYIKAVKTWTTSCAAVLGSLMNVFTSDVIGRLEAADLDLVVVSRRNIKRIIEWVTTEYGGWSDARGTRNYDEMKEIKNFTFIETTNEGFKRLKMLTEEGNNWNNAAKDMRMVSTETGYY